MRRGLSTLIACSAVLLGAGCGSSNNYGGGSGTTSSASSTATSTGAAATTSGGLKPTTTPKYASPESSAPVQSGIVQIAYRNIAIAPDALKVKVGSTIKWTNFDSVEHNVTSKEGPVQFKSGDFGEGKTFQVTLSKPGVIHYLCTIHPASMNGTIEVVQK